MIVNENNSKSYKWNDNKCLGWYLLESPSFNVKLEKIPPGGSTSMHYHRGMSQFFFVKAGILSIEVQDDVIKLHEGDGINLEGNIKHRVFNNSSDWVTYTVSESYKDDCSTYYK